VNRARKTHAIFREVAPVISVITPVYNGERYLAECIESVLAQTRGDWEYLIVDNCSTDRSRDIAAAYSARDPRIRLVTCTEFVNVHGSFSRAVDFMHPQSRYCKFVCADDTIDPRCLELMVDVAGRHPRVGIVSAYRMYGNVINDDRVMPESRETMAGRDVVRRALTEGVHGTGSPTTLLFRADAIRNKRPYLDERFFHSDTDAALCMLMSWDLGFVHQVMSVSRLHADAVTASYADRINTYLTLFVHALIRYGPAVLDAREYRAAMRQRLRTYWWFLFKAMLKPSRRRDAEFQAFHDAQIVQMLRELDAGDRETRMTLRSMRWLLARRNGEYESP